MELLSLADYAHRQSISYNRALNDAIAGRIPARKISGRWFVIVATDEAAVVS